MDGVNLRAGYQKSETLLSISLFIFELSLLFMGLAIGLKGERSLAVFLSSQSGLAFGSAVCTSVISAAVIRHRYIADRGSPSRNFRLIAVMNVITVVLMLIAAEITVRAAVRSYYGYEAVGHVILVPKDWEAIRRYYLKYADLELRGLSLNMHDPILGWTIRPNGQDSSGQYWSSAEGLRAPRENVSFVKHTGQTGIALVGDSYTFGEEVGYQETYGYYLEQLLGSQARVLNFGVPGYGMGQMFLRYEKDVRVWKPKIVILGFISHDVKRTLWAYPFLGDIRWDLPFSKPRFILSEGESEGELVKIVEPLPAPEDIFTRVRISELPLIELQPEYRKGEWVKQFYHVSYLCRFLEAWVSHMNDSRAFTSDESLLAINAEILKAFVRSVEQEGSIPLVVFFPSGTDLTKAEVGNSLGRRVLERAGIDYVDPTPCLLEVDSVDQFRPLLHYTAQGNAAVAKCVYEAVKAILAQLPSGSEISARQTMLPHHH